MQKKTFLGYHYNTKNKNNKYFFAKYLDFDKLFMYNIDE